MEQHERVAAAYCGEHQGAQATGTCGRCGTYVCPLCLDPASASPTSCAACREREGALLVAWERPGDGWLKRWARTCRDVIATPTATFGQARPGSFGAPIAFTATTASVMGITIAIMLACLVGGLLAFGALSGGPYDVRQLGGGEAGVMVGMLAAFLVLYPLVFVVSALIAHGILAGVYHLAAKALGGRGDVQTSSWAAGYLSVGQLAMLPLSVVSYVPVAGPLLALVGYTAVGAWVSVHLTTVARRHHGLEGGRAALAGWAPFLLAVGVSFAGCALVVAVALLELS